MNNILNTGDSSTIGLIFLSLIAIIMFRVIYAYMVLDKTVLLVKQYTKELINTNMYDRSKDYYEEMMFDLYQYAFSFWLITARQGVKPEYRNLLKKYK